MDKQDLNKTSQVQRDIIDDDETMEWIERRLTRERN